mgnify:CR=1 FL=1
MSKNSPPAKSVPRTTRLNESSSISAQVYRQLHSAIIRGEICPGEGLSESEIARQYSTSRQPVREAFIKLAEERLVSIQPQRGTFVVKISVADVLDARFVREAIEIAVTREAATSAPLVESMSSRRLRVTCSSTIRKGRYLFTWAAANPAPAPAPDPFMATSPSSSLPVLLVLFPLSSLVSHGYSHVAFWLCDATTATSLA